MFAVPLHRFGCPDVNKSQGTDNPRHDSTKRMDRTVRVLAFPHELVDMNPMKEHSRYNWSQTSASEYALTGLQYGVKGHYAIWTKISEETLRGKIFEK
jgi:hypothetical protein